VNDLLAQFVIESRELLAQASDGLLQLERTPQDAECLDRVFRAFHTLKGGAGIVEFAAMERAVHAAEELLSEARSSRRKITTVLVEGCLASLDLVGQWLDTLASSGELPTDADGRADALVGRLASIDRRDSKSTRGADAIQPWLAAFRSRHANVAASTAIRYAPAPDCFYQGEDPVVRIATLPLLLAQELMPAKPWPSLSELDPYACNLVLLALSAASVDSVRAHMRGHSGECEVVDLAPASGVVAPDRGISQRGRELLEAQLLLLDEDDAGQFIGRLSSAGLAAANVLMALRRDDEAKAVREATAASLAQKSVESLRRSLERLLAPDAPMPAGGAASHGPDAASATLRVDAERVDALVRLTGELTIAKNALLHTTARVQLVGFELPPELTALTGTFERLIGELQQSVLALRVLPLRTVLQRFPRVLRDLSSTLGKPVTLEIEGDHTEADKAVVEMLFEPLLHTLRNAIDHGIEEANVRLKRGKPVVASIQIRAARQDDRVVIEVEDDGAGVDIERVRRVALVRHVATADELQAMDEAQVIDLIFAPGFSTAATVTELSGRGVGLDAVRTTIERVGGAVSIESRAGQGTCVKFSLPFSVMMTQVMTVEAGGQTFAIPVESLVEIVRVPSTAIAHVGSARALVHRERTIPLIDLAGELHGTQGTSADSEETTVALATVGGEDIALRVDRLGERMQIILKPLEGLLRGMRGITGTTLLGDGRVLLVLDLKELIS
jgi:two-component system chemotaxis sensor kinase CheA